ncbi:MAG: SDR family NAD(P)-dependent oxidoreductase [Clostridia bacterium]|nr:SDR family NAD(P)-dependent oxidoreductase [Clostridia bacterium]
MNIAIITGASSGMGKEFVIQADARYQLDEIWVIARRTERLLELQDEVKTKIVPLSLDLTKTESFETLKQKLEEENPNVKLFVNSSGFGKFATFTESNIESNANMCDLNLKAMIMATQIVLPFIHEGGKIIEVGSLSSFEPVPHLSVYAATKAAVLSFTRALAHELKPKKIRVLCLCPYWVKTEFFLRADEKEKMKKFDAMYEADFVVKVAYNALDKTKKDYVVPGAYAKLLRAMAKIVSHKFMMRVMDVMFKFDKVEK